jgi:hypothetical protein
VEIYKKKDVAALGFEDMIQMKIFIKLSHSKNSPHLA